MASQTIPHIQLLYSKHNSFGFYLKFSKIPKTNITGGKINYNTGSIDAIGNLYISTYENSIVHIGSLYRSEHFYIPFGINVSLVPNYTFALNSETSKGIGLGQEVGLGYHLFYGVMFELLYRTLSFSYGQQTSIGPPALNDDFKFGTSHDFIGSIKYIF